MSFFFFVFVVVNSVVIQSAFRLLERIHLSLFGSKSFLFDLFRLKFFTIQFLILYSLFFQPSPVLTRIAWETTKREIELEDIQIPVVRAHHHSIGIQAHISNIGTIVITLVIIIIIGKCVLP